jgi:hypothetical protein
MTAEDDPEVLYVTQMNRGVAKITVAEDGTPILVSEWGTNGILELNSRVWEPFPYDGKIYIAFGDRNLNIPQILIVDPQTGAYMDMIDLSDYYLRANDAGELLARGPTGVYVSDLGVFTTSYYKGNIAHFDWDGNLVALNGNGDSWGDHYGYEGPTPEVFPYRISADRYGNMYLPEGGSPTPNMVLGLDGTGVFKIDLKNNPYGMFGYRNIVVDSSVDQGKSQYDGLYLAPDRYMIHIPYDVQMASIVPSGVGVEEVAANRLPNSCALSQNFPNPFNPSTTIHFSLAESVGRVNTVLSVYDVNGRLVNTLVSESLDPGTYAVGWDGHDLNGRKVSSGLYLYKLEAGTFSETRRMILLK